jgi:hypothetical protein
MARRLQLSHARLAGGLGQADAAGKLGDRDAALPGEEGENLPVVGVQIVCHSGMGGKFVQDRHLLWAIRRESSVNR